MMYQGDRNAAQSRIELDEEMLDRFFKEVFHGGITDLAVERHLPYSLIYNLAKGRVRSLSARDYRIIFGEEPLLHEPDRVDGTYFRRMVNLWLYLNESATKADLYREFYSDRKVKKVDYRIFSGEVKTVEVRLERIMEQKFLDEGFDRSEIKEAIKELDLLPHEERVSYEYIRPVLRYLEEHLKVSPAKLLSGRYQRYEQGELKTVGRRLFNYTLQLKKEVEKALRSDRKAKIEILREEVYGKREGLTLYVAVKDQLEFLQTYGGKSPNRYLGRSIAGYEGPKLKRIASWRVRNIRNECNELIRKNPDLPMRSIPRMHLQERLGSLISILKTIRVRAMTQPEGLEYEKRILSPALSENPEYNAEKDALTRMTRAAYVLEMSKKAFDLMVAANGDIIRRIGRYDGRWYLPTRYLENLSKKEEFAAVREKYEFLARNRGEVFRPEKQAASVSSERPQRASQYAVNRGVRRGRDPGTHMTGKRGFHYHRGGVILPGTHDEESFRPWADHSV